MVNTSDASGSRSMRSTRTPSVQARAANLALRRWVKPALRGNSVHGVRSIGQRFDRFAGPLPRGTSTTKIKLEHFTGEWVTPLTAQPGRIVLYLPGGGFVMRSPAVHRQLVARLCRQAQAQALLTFYRLAPEHPFPAGLDDCVSAYHRLLATGVEPSNIVIGGDSAGGCLTLATLMALRDQETPLPAAAFTLSAVTDLRIHHDGSRTTNVHRDCMLSLDGSDEWHLRYIGDRRDLLSDPLVSPVLGDFTGLPPLLMQASTTEILLDDTRLAASRARKAGVDCSVQLYIGLPHAWHIMPQLPESHRALREVGAFVRHHIPASP